MTSTLPRHFDYRPDIDGLRACAVLSVVLFHAFPTLLSGGFTGVDVFFVISGYLISGIIIRGLNEGTFGLGNFYARRVRRIFPALLAVLIFCLTLGWFILLPDEYAQLGLHTAGGAGFIANLLFWKEVDYFDVAADAKVLLHLWSLGVEEQFYLIWPLLVTVLWRCRVEYRAPLVITLLLLSFALNILLMRHQPEAAFYFPITRFWELLAGGLLALWSVTGPGPSSKLQRFICAQATAISLAGIALIILASMILEERHAFPGWWAIAPVLGTVMVIAAGQQSRFNARHLSSRPLVLLGLISYPLYMWHWPLLSLARVIEGSEPDVWVRLLAVGFAVILAWMTWVLIEKPIRRSVGPLACRGLLALGIVVAITGAAIHMLAGIPERKAEHLEKLASLSWGRESNLSVSCRRKFREPYLSYCLESRPGAAHGVALIGDSIANQFFWALKDEYAKRGVSVINLGRGSCPALRGVETTLSVVYSCLKISNYILDYIQRTPSIKTVIITEWWRRDILGNLKNIHAPGELDGEAVLRIGLEETATELLRAGKRVVIISGTPELPFPAIGCIRHRPFYFGDRTDKDGCAVTRIHYDAAAARYKKMLAEVREKLPAVVLVDPAMPLCDESWCYGKIDDELLYRDTHHLSRAGAAYVTQRIFDRVYSNEVPSRSVPGLSTTE